MKWYGEQYIKAMKKAKKEALTTGALIVESDSKLRAPVDTGALRSSINSQVNDDEAIIGTNLVYSAKIEFEHTSYLRSALDDNINDIQKVMADIMDKALERGGK